MVDPRLRIVNEAPRPRVLLLNPPSGTAAAFEAVFPTCREISSLSEIQQHEWDVVVTWSGIPEGTSDTLFIVSFGDPKDGDRVSVRHGKDNAWSYYHLAGLGATNATQLAIGNDLPSGVERLANRLLQLELEDDVHHFILWAMANLVFYRGVAFMEPFCATADGDVLAGSYIRGRDDEGPRAKAWLIVRMDIDFLAWTMAAVEDFASLAPERFPQRPAWQGDPEWMTAGEMEATKDRELAESAAATAEENVRAASSHAFLARADADQGSRRLLTGRGQELVHAVTQALEQIGFSVQDRDAALGVDETRVEDIVLTDSADQGWTAIVEVRAFPGEMSWDTVRRVDRFADLFATAHGRYPTQRIAIANSMRGHDPAALPALLRAHPSDAENFGARGGLAIDTAELFKLVRSVELGQLSKTNARTLIKTATGVFKAQ